MTEMVERDEVVDAVLAAARVLVELAARSVAGLSDTVTLPQLRVLVTVASRRSVDIGVVAQDLQVHQFNATRAVNRLVEAGLLDRCDNPADRRNPLFGLTAAGQELVQAVMQRRRQVIAEILEQMPGTERRTLAAGAAAFARAGGEDPYSAVWSPGN